jgi:hypothetical protein
LHVLLHVETLRLHVKHLSRGHLLACHSLRIILHEKPVPERKTVLFSVVLLESNSTRMECCTAGDGSITVETTPGYTGTSARRCK